MNFCDSCGCQLYHGIAVSGRYAGQSIEGYHAMDDGHGGASPECPDPDNEGRFCAECGSDVEGNDPHLPDCARGLELARATEG